MPPRQYRAATTLYAQLRLTFAPLPLQPHFSNPTAPSITALCTTAQSVIQGIKGHTFLRLASSSSEFYVKHHSSLPQARNISLAQTRMSTVPHIPGSSSSSFTTKADTVRIPGLTLLYGTTDAENTTSPENPTQEPPVQKPPTSPKRKKKHPKPHKAIPSVPQRPPAKHRSQHITSAPSDASGGTPVPSPSYMLQTTLPYTPLQAAKPILLVLDLNGTLLHRPRRSAPSRFVSRAHATTFLTYCIATFHVVIWSSARPENVQRLCAQLLTPEQRSSVLATWGRDKFGLSREDYMNKVWCYKRLSTIWSDDSIQARHPYAGHGVRWDQSNTVLIDDSAEKARSEPYNLVEIPEFVGGLETVEVLPQVHDYINTLACQSDISRYIRANPFSIRDNFSLA